MFLKKIKDDNRGIDVSFLGIMVVLICFVLFCSTIDFWVIAYAKENIISRVEIYELNALSSNIDYNDSGYRQNFNEHFQTSEIEVKVEKDFLALFNNDLGKSDGLIKNVRINGEPNCYPVASESKIYLSSGTISFNVKKLLKTEGSIPFIGGKTNGYNNEIITSSVTTCIKILFE